MKKPKLILIAGPCVVESEFMVDLIMRHLIKIKEELDVELIFKASFKKANRTKATSFTGIGDKRALHAIKTVGEYYKIKTITDVHSIEDVRLAEKYVDILQIPAFLCRQTDLIRAAGETGKIVNIKKGQFVSAQSMLHALAKLPPGIEAYVTERGTMFGYQDLIVDFRGIQIMKEFGCKVIIDITHSVQKPNQEDGVSGGDPNFISLYGNLGIVAGVDGIFMEVHPHPQTALSDASSMLDLSLAKEMVQKFVKLKNAYETI